MTVPPARTPILLVTGFLGAGKSTLLRQLARDPSRRWVFLVNEISDHDVDGLALTRLAPQAEVLPLPGGSVFCECLAADLVATLRSLQARAALDPDPVDGLVIEASGTADPRSLDRLLQESGLAAHYRLASIVAVAFPGHVLKLRHTLPAITTHMRAADVVLLNKTDLCRPALTAEAEAWIREINPTARIDRTRHCDAVRLDDWMQRRPRPLPGELTTCADAVFTALNVELSGDLDLAGFASMLSRPPFNQLIHRAKGFVPTLPAGNWVFINATPEAMDHVVLDGPVDRAALVFIVRRDEADQARAALAEHLSPLVNLLPTPA